MCESIVVIDKKYIEDMKERRAVYFLTAFFFIVKILLESD